MRDRFESFRAALLAATALLCVLGVPCRAAETLTTMAAAASVGARAVELKFSLPSVSGESVRLQSVSDARLRVVCFLGCECPVARLYGPRLRDLAQRFTGDGVQFIGINSNPQDSLAKLAGYAEEFALDFPLLKDHDGTVALALGATRTPEVIVLDSLGHIVYQGRIDDQYRPGVVTDSPQRDDLRQAIEEYLQGKPISVPLTAAAGCLIAKRRPIDPEAKVTFADQVSRVLHRHCAECHRTGEIGPFALSDYDEVIGWADMMLEVIEDNRMPPWHANPEHGSFLNSRLMPEKDKQVLRQWVEAGTPFGDASDLPPPPSFASGWQLPTEPDLVLPMAETPFTVPAGGTVEYQYFVVDPGFTEDRWIRAAEVIPGNRSVVHHGIVFVRPPDGVRLEGLGWLTAYVPGQRLPPLGGHLARRVPAGSKLVFQMHYTPTGTIQHDLSQLGLVFADPEAVTEELVTLVGINQGLEIPPRQADVAISGATAAFPQGGQLLAISPHMHLRGKSFQVHAAAGDERQIVLDVPHYDFNWQHTYVLASPLPLQGIEALNFTATYDNSPGNPFNPDPDDFVTWGDQTWEEMAIVFYEVARPRHPPQENQHSGDAHPESVSSTIDDVRSQDRRYQTMADAFFKDLDRDGDGVVRYDEVDRAVQLRLFRSIDTNRDQMIDREELMQYLRKAR